MHNTKNTHLNNYFEHHLSLIGTLYYHTGSLCCQLTNAWFKSLSLSHNELPPRWIAKRWTWGPVRFPVYWCEIPQLKKLDCSLLSALTREALLAQAVICIPVQVIEEHTIESSAQAQREWRGYNTPWMYDRFAYHEIVGIALPTRHHHATYLDGFYLWDPSENDWREIYSDTKNMVGNIIAFRTPRMDTWQFL